MRKIQRCEKSLSFSSIEGQFSLHSFSIMKGLAWVLSHALYTLEREDFGLCYKYGNMGCQVFKEGIKIINIPRLVAHSRILRLFMKATFEAYVLDL